MRLLFDIETDGLLDACTKIQCLVAVDLDTREEFRAGPEDVKAGLELLKRADLLAGHNIVEFDLPVIEKLHGITFDAKVLDTLCASRQAYPASERDVRDYRLHARGQLPREYIGAHSLGSWGARLGFPKGTPPTDFKVYTPETLEYCAHDVQLNVLLLEHLLKRQPESVYLTESAVAGVLFRMRQHGVKFDEEAAVGLMAPLAKKREELTLELRKVFPAWYVPDGKLHTPKRTQVSRSKAPGTPGYVNVAEGCAYSKIKLVEFNPASGAHIADRLGKIRGWKPRNFTDNGAAKTGEEILEDLPWPEVKKIIEFQRIKKILGFVSEGKSAWLKQTKLGRLHARVWATGTITNRMAHSEPNLAQVPKVTSPFGKECRALFTATPGMVLVGCDASGLQLRVLAHYLAKYDGGAFARVVEDPKQDIHTYIQAETGMLVRDNMKTANYAWLFAASEYKLGTIYIADRVNARDLGLYDGPIPGLRSAGAHGRTMLQAMEKKLQMNAMNRNLRLAAKRGHLTSLDGRVIPIRQERLALVTLLQGGEAAVMKRACLLADPRLRALGAHQVLFVHDEIEAECRPEAAEAVGKALHDSIVEAGVELDLRVKLAADYKIGRNWAEVH